jgi:hypothetical protein
MAIYLDDYRKARALRIPTSRSDEEFLYVNRTPMSGVAAPSCFKAPQEPSPQLPDDFAGTDMRALMQRLRALASQI